MSFLIFIWTRGLDSAASVTQTVMESRYAQWGRQQYKRIKHYEIQKKNRPAVKLQAFLLLQMLHSRSTYELPCHRHHLIGHSLPEALYLGCSASLTHLPVTSKFTDFTAPCRCVVSQILCMSGTIWWKNLEKSTLQALEDLLYTPPVPVSHLRTRQRLSMSLGTFKGSTHRFEMQLFGQLIGERQH